MRNLRTLRDPQRDWLKLFEWLNFLIGWRHDNLPAMIARLTRQAWKSELQTIGIEIRETADQDTSTHDRINGTYSTSTQSSYPSICPFRPAIP